jgi:hypothetical protein
MKVSLSAIYLPNSVVKLHRRQPLLDVLNTTENTQIESPVEANPMNS